MKRKLEHRMAAPCHVSDAAVHRMQKVMQVEKDVLNPLGSKAPAIKVTTSFSKSWPRPMVS